MLLNNCDCNKWKKFSNKLSDDLKKYHLLFCPFCGKVLTVDGKYTVSYTGEIDRLLKKHGFEISKSFDDPIDGKTVLWMQK